MMQSVCAEFAAKYFICSQNSNLCAQQNSAINTEFLSVSANEFNLGRESTAVRGAVRSQAIKQSLCILKLENQTAQSCVQQFDVCSKYTPSSDKRDPNRESITRWEQNQQQHVVEEQQCEPLNAVESDFNIGVNQIVKAKPQTAVNTYRRPR
jgi:exonuclease III